MGLPVSSDINNNRLQFLASSCHINCFLPSTSLQYFSYSTFIHLSIFLDTTRSPSHEELSGVDYIFFTRPMFEKSITAADFIEHGQHEGHYYGTSFKAVRDVIGTGKTCILNIHCSVRTMFSFLPSDIFVTSVFMTQCLIFEVCARAYEICTHA